MPLHKFISVKLFSH